MFNFLYKISDFIFYIFNYLLTIFINIKLHFCEKYENKDNFINSIILKNNHNNNEIEKSYSIMNIINNNKIDWNILSKKFDINSTYYIFVKYELENTKYNLIIPYENNFDLNLLINNNNSKLLKNKIIYAEYINENKDKKDVTSRIKKFAGPKHNFYNDHKCFCYIYHIFSNSTNEDSLTITFKNGDEINFKYDEKLLNKI